MIMGRDKTTFWLYTGLRRYNIYRQQKSNVKCTGSSAACCSWQGFTYIFQYTWSQHHSSQFSARQKTPAVNSSGMNAMDKTEN